MFNCQKWLATDKEDGKISRELPALDLAQSKLVTFRPDVKNLKEQILLESEANFAASTIKQLNAISTEAPLKKHSLDDIMNVCFIFVFLLNLTISLIISSSFFSRRTQLVIKMKYL